MMYNFLMPYSSKQRREWLRWHFENGQNASATCRHFNIARGTLFRWLARYDEDKPSKALRDRSRRPRRKRKPTWTDLGMRMVADLTMYYPWLGAGKLLIRTQGFGLPYSRATLGRMLRIIRRRCPICKRGQGPHYEAAHIMERDLYAARELGTGRHSRD